MEIVAMMLSFLEAGMHHGKEAENNQCFLSTRHLIQDALKCFILAVRAMSLLLYVSWGQAIPQRAQILSIKAGMPSSKKF
jgi:hypothetical protein